MLGLNNVDGIELACVQDFDTKGLPGPQSLCQCSVDEHTTQLVSMLYS